MAEFVCSANTHGKNFAAIRTNKYNKEAKMSSIIVLKLDLIVSERAHAQFLKQLPCQETLLRTTWKKLLVHFDIYIEIA